MANQRSAQVQIAFCEYILVSTKFGHCFLSKSASSIKDHCQLANTGQAKCKWCHLDLETCWAVTFHFQIAVLEMFQMAFRNVWDGYASNFQGTIFASSRWLMILVLVVLPEWRGDLENGSEDERSTQLVAGRAWVFR